MIPIQMLVLAGALALEGSVVTTSSGRDAVIVWDASPIATRMADRKAAALHELEMSAVRLLLERAPHFRAATRTVSVRVVYQRKGDENPLYGTANFEGIVPIVTVVATRGDAVARRKVWEAALAAGKLPAGVRARVFVNADNGESGN